MAVRGENSANGYCAEFRAEEPKQLTRIFWHGFS
jgi:hypothetical protein